MNYEILKEELALPAYDGMANFDICGTKENPLGINLVNISAIKSRMSGSDIFLQTDPTEYSGLADSKKSEWLAFCGIDSHNPKNNGVAHLFVAYVFGNGSITLANLATERTYLVSRATELGLPFVKLGSVEAVR